MATPDLSEAFVAAAGERWLIVTNHDHCDAEGNWGMSSRTHGDPKGYRTYHEGMEALHQLRGD